MNTQPLLTPAAAFAVTIADLDAFTESQLVDFLGWNYGLRGVNGQGITRLEENRTLENIRAEAVSQFHYIHQAGL